MSKNIRFNEGIYEDLLAEHDLIYEKAPQEWERGIPMGNSKISAMVWGDDRLKVTINRGDVWEMRRYQPPRETFNWQTFTERLAAGSNDMTVIFQTNADKGPVPQNLPVGLFEVSTAGTKWLDYRMRLDLYDAVTSGSIVTDKGTLKWDCHVSALNDIIVFNYETYDEEEAGIRFRFSSKLDEFKPEFEKGINPYRFKGLNRGYERKNLPEVSHILQDWGYPQPDFLKRGEVEVYRQVIPENGNYAVAHTVIKTGRNRHSLIVSITQDDVNGKAEEEAFSNVVRFACEAQLAIEIDQHRKWWHDFYHGSFFSLNDTRLEALYWINIYKLGCVSRIDGQATPMSGLWIPDDSLAPWGNTYIWNTQQEMPFFGTYVGNRLDTQLPTYRLLKEHRAEMRKIGEEYFGVKGGEYLVHLTDYKLGCPNYTKDHMQAVSGPWMMQMMWNYYRFSLDKDFLADEVYDMMKAQFRVLVAMLEKGEDGKLHFPWTMSAEYPPMGGHLSKNLKRFGPDATSDLAYTKWLAKTLMEAEKVLGLKDEEERCWKEVLENIADYKYDEFGGLVVRADMPLSDSHRHLSHLFPITQTHEINADSPEGVKTIRACLHALKVAGPGEWMGWTFSETAKIAQMLGEAEMADNLIREYSDRIVYENTMDFNGSRDNGAFTYHVGFGLTIDSDGMFNEALQNFALTSYNDANYIFMAVPKRLKDISFHHFRSEGAFLVSGQLRNGEVEFIAVEPLMGGRYRFISPLQDDIQISCDGKNVEFACENGKVCFETEAGREYIITPKGKSISQAYVKLVKPRSHEINCFGLKG